MKRIGAMLVSIFLLMLAPNLQSEAKKSPPLPSAGVVRCSLSGSTYIVTAASLSTGAPSIPVSSSCGQALADLTNAGFEINNTQFEQSSLSLVYTLINSPDSD
jgi:hypothetical protein